MREVTLLSQDVGAVLNRTTEPEDESTAEMPVVVDANKIYLTVRKPAKSGAGGGESEIAGRRPSLQQALHGLSGLARTMGQELSTSGAAKVSVQFGCEFALESGAYVAIVGKASAKSVFTVSLEWDNTTP